MGDEAIFCDYESAYFDGQQFSDGPDGELIHKPLHGPHHTTSGWLVGKGRGVQGPLLIPPLDDVGSGDSDAGGSA